MFITVYYILLSYFKKIYENLKTNLFMVHSVSDYKITIRVPILKFSVIVLYDASIIGKKIIIFRNGELTRVRVQRLQLFISNLSSFDEDLY